MPFQTKDRVVLIDHCNLYEVANRMAESDLILISRVQVNVFRYHEDPGTLNEIYKTECHLLMFHGRELRLPA